MPYARGWHGVNKNTDTTHTCILTVHTRLARTRTGAVSLTDTVSRCRSRSTHYGTSRVDRDVLGDRRLSVSLDRACLARGARRPSRSSSNTLYTAVIFVSRHNSVATGALFSASPSVSASAACSGARSTSRSSGSGCPGEASLSCAKGRLAGGCTACFCSCTRTCGGIWLGLGLG